MEARKKKGKVACVAGLAPLEAEMLKALRANSNKLNAPYLKGEKEPGWCRPADLGGKQKSHHCSTLRRLVRKGFAVDKPYGTSTASLRIYRISELGVSAWALYAEHVSS